MFSEYQGISCCDECSKKLSRFSLIISLEQRVSLLNIASPASWFPQSLNHSFENGLEGDILCFQLLKQTVRSSHISLCHLRMKMKHKLNVIQADFFF